jgi:hypothetical protein
VLLPLLLLLAACSAGAPDTSGNALPPEGGPHVYLLFRPASEQQGWAAIGALREKLSARARARIRTAGLVSSQQATMYVDVDGACDGIVKEATRIAAAAGTPQMTCSATLPGAL